jgi:hypothetical protein
MVSVKNIYYICTIKKYNLTYELFINTHHCIWYRKYS